ncbi:hypothetical protein GCK72_007551 [Caenorhabditis remanei]|uniref:Uncharacterized protein n=1 Tax=Caenorhabditis remanei TaxID=31234 RepID=A0A6A5HP66_CAERE|nr:hypothetical protein GCK72_007551 [Caenorhabditis remanei]KAF1767592.1 hypothetical protein GCK72_007551 [Caenorhabditis remanei]
MVSSQSSHSSRDSWRPDAVDETLTLEFGSPLSLNSGNVMANKKIGIGHANCICTCKCGAHHKAAEQENVGPQGTWEKSVSAMLYAKPEELIGAYRKPEPAKSSAELLAKMAAARQSESGFWGNPGESSNSGTFGHIGKRSALSNESKGNDGPSGTYNLFGGSNNLLSLGK